MTASFPLRAGLLRVAAASLAFALLSACNLLPKRSEVRLFDPQPRIAANADWPRVDWQLTIPRPHADSMLDSPRILVRPEPGEVQVYKGAAWTQAAPDLVLDTLLRAFSQSDRLPGVARRGEAVSADYALLLDLHHFESDYTASGAPQARIAIGARLVRSRDRRVIASRSFESLTPAEATDIASVAHAFERGLGEISGSLVAWTLTEGAAQQR